MKLAGVVILYHPDENIVENINSYITDIDFLYIVDNSDDITKKIKINLGLLNSKRYKYINLKKNMGIAYPLNFVLSLVNEFDFLLTMDQDSKFPPSMLEKYKQEIRAFNDYNIAMYTLNYNPNKINKCSCKFSEIEKTITSGAIVSVKVAKKIGGFNEDLFIDEVDHEFCFRARKNGYKIIKFNNIYLLHHLGNPITKKILGHHFGSTNHSPIRKYYITRNKIYVMKKYPKVWREYVVFFVKTFIAMMLLENHRITKLWYIFRGIKDGLVNNMGKLK